MPWAVGAFSQANVHDKRRVQMIEFDCPKSQELEIGRGDGKCQESQSTDDLIMFILPDP